MCLTAWIKLLKWPWKEWSNSNVGDVLEGHFIVSAFQNFLQTYATEIGLNNR